MSAHDVHELSRSLASSNELLRQMWTTMAHNNADAASLAAHLDRINRVLCRTVGEEPDRPSPQPSALALQSPVLGANDDGSKAEGDLGDVGVAVGDVVRLVGLQHDVALNGREATVVAGLFDGKVLVALHTTEQGDEGEGGEDGEEEEEEESLLVLPANLEPVYEDEDEGEGEGEGENECDDTGLANNPQPPQPAPQARQAPTDGHVLMSGPVADWELDAAMAEVGTNKPRQFRADEGWEQFLAMAEVTAFRRPVEGKPVYLYKSESELRGVDFDTFVRMYVDLKYRESWDDTAIKIEELASHQGNAVVYWAVKLPWPMACRDYVYYHRVKRVPRDNIAVVMCRGAKLGEFKGEVKDFVRVEDYVSHTVIKREDNGAVKIFCTYMDDPKGSIPKFIVNFASKQGFPKMMEAFHKAYAGFPEYEKQRGPAQLPEHERLEQESQQNGIPANDEPQEQHQDNGNVNANDNNSGGNNDSNSEVAAVQSLPHPQTHPHASLRTFRFEYDHGWGVVVQAVLALKRRPQQGQSVEEDEGGALEFHITTTPPPYVDFLSPQQELEWEEILDIQEEAKQLRLEGTNVTWANRFCATENSVWRVCPNNPNHTVFETTISLSIATMPRATTEQILDHVVQDMLDRRREEARFIEEGHQRDDREPAHNRSRVVPPPIPSGADNLQEWVLARSVLRSHIRGSTQQCEDGRDLMALEVHWEVGAAVRAVAVQWFRHRKAPTLPAASLFDSERPAGHRETVPNADEKRLVLGVDEYGCVMEAVLRPVLAEGGYGPSVRVKHPAWVDKHIEAELAKALKKNEAKFKVWAADGREHKGQANSRGTPGGGGSAKDALALVVDKTGVKVRQGVFESVFAAPFVTGVSVRASDDAAQALVMTSPMYEDEPFVFRLASARERDIAVLVVRGLARVHGAQ